jgi:tripartite-type tricarboxylate transporter receptor subunit TctC
MRPRQRIVQAAAALAALLAAASAASGDPVADFYRGKTVRVIIGYGPGGGYDIYGRLAAEFLGRHLPGNPTIVPVNMPGGGSLKAIDYLYNVAPQDGTQLGSVSQQMALNAVVADKTTIDVTRLRYIGRFTTNIDIAVALPQTGITSFEDARRREVVLGADQSGSMSVVYALTLNAYAGGKLKIVRGYSGSAEVQLAAERGEIEVNGSYSLPAVLVSRPDWVRERKVTILYQNALRRFHELPHVPTVAELVYSDEGRAVAQVIAGTAEIGRSILTTPGVPPDRLVALRAAFQQMLQDPDFIAAGAKRGLLLDPAAGEAMDTITAQTMSLPRETVEALRKLLRE